MWYMLLILWLTSPDAVSELKTDETVVFFPTVGHFDKEDRVWIIPISGWIYEEERDSLTRKAALGALRRQLGLGQQDEESATFKERARRFLVDNERGKRVCIRLGQRVHTLPESEANGHFATTLRIQANALPTQPATAPTTDRWLTYEAVLPQGDPRRFQGASLLLSPGGLSVVSDIDDTIKVTHVADREIMLVNTFLLAFRAVPDMAAAYRNWEKAGASFHYVSASPWQLYDPLSQFLATEGFPQGTFHLKTFRLKDSSFLNLFDGPYEYKLAILDPLLKAFPQRRFIFVGDSGEKDPEVYSHLARQYPKQVLKIHIRDVTDEPADSPRYKQTFDQVPQDRWQIFRDARELPAVPIQ